MNSGEPDDELSAWWWVERLIMSGAPLMNGAPDDEWSTWWWVECLPWVERLWWVECISWMTSSWTWLILSNKKTWMAIDFITQHVQYFCVRSSVEEQFHLSSSFFKHMFRKFEALVLHFLQTSMSTFNPHRLSRYLYARNGGNRSPSNRDRKHSPRKHFFLL